VPGLSLAADLAPDPGALTAQAARALASLALRPGVRRRVLHRDARSFLAVTALSSYPLASLPTPHGPAWLEGRLYDRASAELSADVAALADAVFAHPETACERVRRWVLGVDGDFVLVLVDATSGRIALLNDALGRLPLYLRRDGTAVVLSREIGFLPALLGTPTFDRLAIAHSLLLVYPLGARTLLAGVERLAAASLVRIDPAAGSTSVDVLHALDLGARENGTAAARVEALVARFQDACVRRAAEGSVPTVVALSGGLDSRAAAAALGRAGVAAAGVTRCGGGTHDASDARVAAEVARALGMPWHRFDVPPPAGAEALELLRLKAGLNPLGMAFTVPFLRAVAERFGEGAVLVTGDGGDKALPDLRPATPLLTLDDLVAHVTGRAPLFALDTVSALTGVPASAILDDVRSRLASYPEARMSDRWLHFLVHERAMKWLFEGEDRNRAYLWSVAPFWALPFFTLAMRAPDDEKAHYELYLRFLQRLSPAAARVRNANWGLPAVSFGARAYLRGTAAFHRLPAALREAVRRVRPPDPPHPPPGAVLRCLDEQLGACDAIRAYLDADRTRATARRATRAQLLQLLTITSAVEAATGSGSTLARYADLPLG
jgi:asparagine synthase (glutamine-hydrolysing)